MPIGEDEIRPAIPIVGIAGRNVRLKETKAFQLCKLQEFVSVLVVLGVSKCCVTGIEVCQYVDWYVCVVEETVEAGEKEPSIQSAVCGGNKKLPVLCFDLGGQEVG